MNNIELAKSLGLNVIPLQNVGDLKKPTLDWGPYKTQKYEGEINGNYGVICGKISGDLFVVDLDSADLYPAFEAFADKTLVVKTGRGYHLYFRWNGKEAKTVKLTNPEGKKLEIRSDGAYVVGFGSKHNSGITYEIISTTNDILTIETRVIRTILEELKFNVDDVKKPINEIVKGVTTGERNDSAFKYACHLLQRVGLTEDLAWHEMGRWNSTNTPPMPEFELKTVFNSALRRIVHDKSITYQMSDYIKQEESIKTIKPELVEEEPINLDGTIKMRQLSSKYEGKIITFDCFIAAMDEHKTATISATFKCYGCQAEQDNESKGFENVKAPFCSKCKMRYTLQKATKKTIDIRSILLQELPEEMLYNQPARIDAKVNGDNAKKVFIGQRKRITGEFVSKEDKDGEENTPMIYISKLENIEEDEGIMLTQDEADTIKKDINNKFIEEKIVPSFANDVYGHEEIKELLLYTIAGGVKRGRTRGDINMFIPGNPSKGKSQLLKFTKMITDKSTYVNGRSSSAAGLLYGMVKMSNGTSVPQAGPFVLNSGGFVMLDEVDKMDKKDRYGLLEAMEQQTVSFAKAGVNISVKAETAVIAAANPAFGRWDDSMTKMDNLEPLEKPFISRFDIIYPIINVTKELNEKIADHIINQSVGEEIFSYMDILTLKHYLNYVRKLTPTLSKEAGQKIKKFYNDTLAEMEHNKDALPMEERQLEGLVRLSTARAKLLMKDQVDCDDVDRIIYLYRKSIISFPMMKDSTRQDNNKTSKEDEQQVFLGMFNRLKDDKGLVLISEIKEEMSKHEKFANKNLDFIITNKMQGLIYIDQGGKVIKRMGS